MNQDLKNLIANGIAFALEQLGETITYQGNSYSAVVSDIVTGSKTEIEGLVLLPDLTLSTPKTGIAIEPKKGEEMTVRNKVYRIETTADTADGNEWVINLMGLTSQR